MGADLLLVAVPYVKNKDWKPLVASLTDEEIEGLVDREAWEGQDARAKALEYCTNWQTAVDEGYRDTTVLTLDGKHWGVTGGMSWGDDPTESWAYGTVAEYVVWCHKLPV